MSCFGPMTVVVNVLWLKGVTMITSSGDERDECKRTPEDPSKYLK